MKQKNFKQANQIQDYSQIHSMDDIKKFKFTETEQYPAKYSIAD